jgi:hypothetical protein
MASSKDRLRKYLLHEDYPNEYLESFLGCPLSDDILEELDFHVDETLDLMTEEEALGFCDTFGLSGNKQPTKNQEGFIPDNFSTILEESAHKALACNGIVAGRTIYCLTEIDEDENIGVQKGIITEVCPFGNDDYTDTICHVTVKNEDGDLLPFSMEDFGRSLFFSQEQAMEVYREKCRNQEQEDLAAANAILNGKKQDIFVTDCETGSLGDDEMQFQEFMFRVSLRVPSRDVTALVPDICPAPCIFTDPWADVELAVPYAPDETGEQTGWTAHTEDAMVTVRLTKGIVRSDTDWTITRLYTEDPVEVPLADVPDKSVILGYLAAASGWEDASILDAIWNAVEQMNGLEATRPEEELEP